MIDSCIYHDLSKPTFERVNRISISGLESIYLNENFQEPVIEDLGGIFFVVSISVADRHSIPIERAIYFFLALPVIQDTSPDMKF
jgi:hypothetical protein